MSSTRVALTRAQVRELDRIAIEELGIPGCVLMENAGGGAARAAIEFARTELGVAPEALKVVILCGAGNNGGDGYVVARHLAIAGARVQLFATTPHASLKGDALWAATVCERMGLRAEPFSAAGVARFIAAGERDMPHAPLLLIDALLGTGATGSPRPPIADAIAALNELRTKQSRARTIALDLPSGLDADRGEPGIPCVRADLTATFAAPKPGLLNPAARSFVGELVVVDLGVPRALLERVRSRS